MMLSFPEIKEKYSCLDVAQSFGLQLRRAGSNEYRGKSIVPGEHEHSEGFSINTELNIWRDFSGDMGGSVLDLYAYLKFGDTSRILEAAKALAGDDYDNAEGQKYIAERDTFLAQIEQYHKDIWLDEKVLDYLHSRRINDETIKRLKFGVGELPITVKSEHVRERRLTIPYFDEFDNIRYMVSRRLDWAAHDGSDKYYKKKQNTYCRNLPFGLQTIPPKDKDCDILVIGEGAIDAVSLIQEGYSVLFSIGGAFGAGASKIDTVIKQCKRFRKIVTCYDIDGNKSGQNFTREIGKLFLRERLNFYCVADYGEKCKDVSDYYTAGGDLAELLNNRTINGYVFMAQMLATNDDGLPFRSLSPNDQAKQLNDVKHFVQSLKTFIDTATLSLVVDILCRYYPEDKIKKFAQPPSEHEVLCSLCDKFLDGRSIFHYGDGQHGEFWQYNHDKGAWDLLKDIQAEISQYFNHELKNKDINALAMMVRLKVHTKDMPQFNNKPVFVFSNGTLELDTGIFREHKADDYSTMPHKFTYDENAKCDIWDAFLQQVSAGEQSRIDFLDDLAAYVMCPDNSQQKAFFLIGNGANGKGVYLHVLERLFGCDGAEDIKAVTAIEPADLERPTERIQLQASILNVAGEINTDLRKSLTFIKALTGDDTLSGNRKFHNTVHFKSRAKLVCSCNKIPQFNDADFATRRRLMFCLFTQCFSGKADINLESKLKAELPGIFNRVYRAYKALKERIKTHGDNAIRPSIDQPEIMRKFENINNPVAAFWTEYGEDYCTRREVLKEEIYSNFKEFCENNGFYASSNIQFHPALQTYLKENGITSKETQKTIRNADGTQKRVRCYMFFLSTRKIEDEPQPQPENSLSGVKIYRARYKGEECTIKDFRNVITNTYGAGDMNDIQVWFTVKEVTEKVNERGFALTETRAQEYLNRLLRDKRRLIEAREDMFRGLEYRRVTLMRDTALAM